MPLSVTVRHSPCSRVFGAVLESEPNATVRHCPCSRVFGTLLESEPNGVLESTVFPVVSRCKWTDCVRSALDR
jgi:hypothetical protein